MARALSKRLLGAAAGTIMSVGGLIAWSLATGEAVPPDTVDGASTTAPRPTWSDNGRPAAIEDRRHPPDLLARQGSTTTVTAAIEPISTTLLGTASPTTTQATSTTPARSSPRPPSGPAGTPLRSVAATAPAPATSSPSPPTATSGTRTLHVLAGAAAGGDGTLARPFTNPSAALASAGPGDIVSLGPGTFVGKVTTVRSGTPERPIRIVGAGGVLTNDGTSRLLQIRHDHVWLEGLRLTGATTLVWIESAHGVRILDSILEGAGGECVRIMGTSTGAEIGRSVIRDCGMVEFDLASGHKNGEAIYVGTAPEERARRGSSGPDRSDRGFIHDNVLVSPSECVDIKEDVEGTTVRANRCTGGLDPNGAGMTSRGRGTTFEANISTGNAGAGIQLTGDGARDGTGSIVRSNVLTGNSGYGLKVVDRPQAMMCGNDLSGNGRAPTTPAGAGADLPCP